ncbi:MAG: vitamin K epoxide reductase family protein [Chloroflexota bacterium]
MKHFRIYRRLVSALLAAILIAGVQIASAAEPVARAVLFYSPSCSHCHYVIEEVLTPMIEEYGDRLLIIGIDVTQDSGQALYANTIEHLSIPEDRVGVPTLVVGDTVLIGSGEIPEKFPAIVEGYLAGDGVDWPDVPGLEMVLAANGLAATDEPAPTATVSVEQTADEAEPVEQVVAEVTEPETAVSLDLESAAEPEGVWARFNRDPVGNGLAIAVLIGMIAALLFAIVRVAQAGLDALPFDTWPAWKWWAVALLCLAGLGVSAYLTYVETTETAAVCGPIGDCNTVQQSEYASLFGILPIGVMGLIGYGLMLLAWAGTRWGTGSLHRTAGLALLGMALLGTLFSIYLTFLEPFVIGATCAWCLTSAVIMTLILLLCIPTGRPTTAQIHQARA